MINVQKIQIEEFRGIKKLVLEFNGKNYAVCGPNGTGKSGVVDALEFALTGNISRLSGEGMGNVSVKAHAPHVDSRNNPEKARVIITFKIPSLNNKEVVLERSVKDASYPKITPISPEILAVISQFDGHPEFVLSRREIIRYVISKPGNRSEEIQALLRLNEVGDIRSNLKTISNAYERESKDFKRVQIQSAESLAQALEITELVKEKILEAANLRRTILGLAPLTDLKATTSLIDGLETVGKAGFAPKINKLFILADLKLCTQLLQKVVSDDIKMECSDLKKQLEGLSSNPMLVESVSREKFLRVAIEFVTEQFCPVCGTDWDISTLQNIIRDKLKKFEEVSKTRIEIERRLSEVISLIDEVEDAIVPIEKIAKTFSFKDLTSLSLYRTSLATFKKSLNDFLPIIDTISAIKNVYIVPVNVLKTIGDIEREVAKIPEPTHQDAARDYLIRSQDRLEAYRKTARDAEKAKQRASLTNKIYDIYTDISNKSLEGIYKDVEDDFSDLYCFINSEDEGKFTAKLTPSMGKLGFDVDFYGRGHFPPGAYHSEGHQDAMGLCLYLALMHKLQGKNFKFVVLDDVLMSVDTDHRREVCNLLKQKFSDTQFILTTHDEVWMKLMKTVGLITAGNEIRFSNWTPDQGPADWKTRDIWTEIDSALDINDVHTAASSLRYYLEHIFREACDNLRAKVEFKGDGRYELGDTLAPSVRRFRDIILDGVKIAEAWNQTDVAEELKLREKSIGESLTATNTEQWMVNPAIHYNEWANFSVNDFKPVASAFKNLVGKFFCEKPDCAGMFYLSITPPKTEDAVRCQCGNTNINLKKPEN